MKKITLLFVAILPFISYSQAPTEKIQAYLNANHDRLGLTAQDVTGWFIESEASSSNTNINNYYLKQRHAGIEIFRAVSNVWVKNGEVINIGDRFVSNAAAKANAVSPSISVLEGLSDAMAQLGAQNPGDLHIISTQGSRNFTISNGALTDEDPVIAELVYQPLDDNTLRLAWDYTFYTSDYKHLWSVRIDALNGNVLDKQDMIISCTYEAAPLTASALAGSAFTRSFYKESKSSMMEIQAGSYRVIPYNMESLNFSPRELVVSPDNPVASPFGWHDTNGVAGAEYTITRGNNSYAMEDTDGGNGTGATANGGASLTFDFPYGGVSAQPSTYVDASITNLFYMTNIMHDVWFQYGFNEQNGNFQQKNYSGFSQPGFGGDAVNADAQDGSGSNPQNLNNANFATPVDGSKPRMQMYLWNVAPSIQPLTIISPADFAGPRDGRDNVFNPGHVDIPIAPALIQSDLVLYDDGTPDAGTTDNADACGPAVNAAAINGHIVVIRRSLAEALGGSPCTFIEKVKNAQNAGATAAIIVNNVAPSDTVPAGINMSGADAAVTIPAISLTQAVGEALIARMKIETVNGKIQLGEPPYVNADGDLDNGIIAHEFGHGISTRLTGGAGNSSCLNNAEQAGEGWSDWFALMMFIKPTDQPTDARTIATWAVSQTATGSGIRNFPYSTDMGVNPLTFADSNDTESHNRGEFMTTVLWDLTWAYIDKYGFDANIYSGSGGNNKIMKIVIDAMKLQPCSPTFIDFRNSIIAADQAATGGADYCMIWTVFARRGMGINASSGSSASATDQVENFQQPPAGPNCSLAVNYFQHDDLIRVYPNPSNGIFTIKVSQFSGKANIMVTDMNGRVVYDLKNSELNIEKTINLSGLQSGMYLLKLTGEALNYSQKLILK